MRMNVRAVFTPRLIRAGPDESLADAASRMEFEEVGALPVFEGGRLVGILTESDVVRAMADGVDPSATPLGEYMTAEPVTTPVDADLSEAAEVAATGSSPPSRRGPGRGDRDDLRPGPPDPGGLGGKLGRIARD